MYNQKMETLSREDLHELQSRRLRALVQRVYENVPFYKTKFDEMDLTPQDIKGIEDLYRLPFTVKQDLRDNYPFKLLATPMSEIVEIHASSGTTGKPTTVAMTKNDLSLWSEMSARALSCAGVNKNSVVQVSYGYGLFTGGFGAHYGTQSIGAAVLPMSVGNTRKQLMLMHDYKTTHLACTPSYAATLAEALYNSGKTTNDISLQAGIFGAEPWSEELRHSIEEKLNLEAYDIYGLSEIMGPGVAMECSEHNGLHIWEDLFYPEIIDPNTGEVLPDGEEGELVITTLTKEALPLIRYRTRDISSLSHEKCSCGRTHAKINRVKARTDDMLIIRGVNVFPSQIESVILEVEGVEPYYTIIVSREGTLDNVEIQIEMSENFSYDKISSLERLEKTLKSRLQSVLGISSKIKLMEPRSLQRFEGKAVRVIDKRKEKNL